MPDGSDSALWNAYRETLFEAATPFGSVCIRVGEGEPTLDRLLGLYGARSWCFITAANPASKPLDPATNRARNQELRRALEALALPALFHGAGRSPRGDWEPEPSLLALGVECAEALRLGRAFGQNAVVWGRAGGVAELIDCRGDASRSARLK
jgi:hypothetical protein